MEWRRALFDLEWLVVESAQWLWSAKGPEPLDVQGGMRVETEVWEG